jgi:PAS domain S-box-containing protein
MRATQQVTDAVLVADLEGRIVYVNRAFEEATGYRLEDVRGQSPGILEAPGEPTEPYERMRSTLARGETFRGILVSRRRDGSLQRMEQTVSPVREVDGTVTHFVATGRDVGAQPLDEKSAERLHAATSRAAREWRATFDAIEVAILALDDELRIRRPNRAARDLAGRPYVALLGARLTDLGPEPLFASLGRVAEATRRHGRTTAEHVESHGRSWETTATALASGAGGAEGVIVVARDVTSLTRLSRELRESETMSAMGRLVAGVAHEVRNPLFAISSLVDAFEEELGVDSGFDDFCVRLRREVERMSTLMQELLDYGRPGTGDPVDVSLEEVLAAAVRACETHADAAGVGLEALCHHPLPSVVGEPRRLMQAFLNLLQNGIQHSPVGSRVLLHTIERESDVEIAVLDSGPGFQADDLPHVFEPFFTRRRGGTGMGLAIVQRIVVQHQGAVSAANRLEGGAVLTVRLPKGKKA